MTRTIRREQLSNKDLKFLEKVQSGKFADKIPSSVGNFVPKVLIGIDYYFDLIQQGPGQKLPSGLHLINLKLGLLIGGRVSK